MRNLVIFGLILFAVSCRNVQAPTADSAPATEEVSAQTVDMESSKIEQDGVLKFGQTVIDLGEIPLGESREVTLSAANLSDKPLVLLDIYTSCDCTKVSWDKKPIASHKKTDLKIHFSAEQVGTFFKKIVVKHSAQTTPVTFSIQGVVVNSSEKDR